MLKESVHNSYCLENKHKRNISSVLLGAAFIITMYLTKSQTFRICYCFDSLLISHLSFPQSVVEQVCRLSRTIASPHEGANSVLVAEGCPGRTSLLVKLAAHLCGFTVFQPSPTPNTTAINTRLDQFKSDLVMAYTRAGTKVCVVSEFQVWATRGVTVSTSAFLACHQCYCVGSSLA